MPPAPCSGATRAIASDAKAASLIGTDIDAAVRAADVLIDFTRPSGTMKHLAACAERGVAAVVGTTGLDATQKAELAERAKRIPIVFAPNMSVGVNVLAKLVERARARAWARL